MKNKISLRRILAFALASVMMVGGASSCATPDAPNKASECITVTSSDGEKYAEWLTERLDVIPDDVSLGIGDDESYAVDMSNFEDDGYILKRLGGDVIIFGKTEDGLDRGVRKYANLIDLGETVNYITSHEGERIECLEVFGTDISEYTVVYPEKRNANMDFAVSELVSLVEEATGVTLPTAEGDCDSAHKIILRQVEDPALEDDGYRYFEENGSLVIEGAVARGCMNGVYRFLQKECDWDGLIYGESYLNESDYINIPEGIYKTETPAFKYFCAYDNLSGDIDPYTTSRRTPTDAENSYGALEPASHGMQNNRWDGYDHGTWSQACYDPEGSSYEVVYDNVMKYLDKAAAEGKSIGQNCAIDSIDIAQADNNFYCQCQGCMEIAAEENSMSGPLLRFANRLAEEVNAEYPGVAILIYGYFATKIPPTKTKAHDMVYVTFTPNGSCMNHFADGSECGEKPDPSTYDDYLITDNNKNHDEWLRGWCDVAKNVYARPYMLFNDIQEYTVIDVIYEDMMYYKELGVVGVYYETEYIGFGIKRVEHQLLNEMNWEMSGEFTKEDYNELLKEILYKEYGSGTDCILEYIDMWIESLDRYICTNCWAMDKEKRPYYDFAYMRSMSPAAVELIEKAIAMADDSAKEHRVKILSLTVIYQYLYTDYFHAYEANDTEWLAKLEGEYQRLLVRMAECGHDLDCYGWVLESKMYPTLEEEMWRCGGAYRTEHMGGGKELRPAPKWYTKLLETEDN